MFTRLVGALVRAATVAIVILTPSLLGPGTGSEGAGLLTLLALALAMIAAFEYSAKSPGLIPFRDAPPFNRIRIIALFLTLFGSSAISQGGQDGSTMVMVITALGHRVGQAMDVPFSPLPLMLDALPRGIDASLAARFQAMAGLSMFISALALCLFAVLVGLERWPNRDRAFNIWINLPTFVPTEGEDIAKRLNRTGGVNLIFGFFAPFVIPVVVVIAADRFQVPVFGAPQTMIWAVAIWMFFPLSLIMRGLAMLRIAAMITRRRARFVASVGGDGLHSPLSSSAA